MPNRLRREIATTPRAAEPELPVLHRAAIIYLALPVGIWLLGWFEWWFGIPATALLVAGLWPALSGSWRVSLNAASLALLLVALIWVMLTQAGGLLDLNNGHLQTHRAAFLDLGRGPWPTYLTPYIHDEPPLLRYYLGWWMPPGLAGKWFGAWALNWAVPLWTWGGVALVTLLFARGGATVHSYADA